MKKGFIKKLGFQPKENSNNVYTKKYKNNYILEVDFDAEKFNYGTKIQAESKTTQNFSQAENWVVFECVNRLLEKGYNPEDITLEKVFPSGHGTSGRLDILVEKDGKAFLMIECKTWGKEFDKEFNNLNKNGGQLFTYFRQNTDTEFLILYASNIDSEGKIEYNSEIVKIEDAYRETSNVADFYERWNKLTKQNGVFENWINAYDFESRALTYELLEDIKEEDSSYIFNRFLEILRHNTVSDKPNAFNKMFTLFLCKIYDELSKQGTPDELEFQWVEGKDNNVSFQKKLTDLYKKGMAEFLSKQVTDFSDEDFENQFGNLIKDKDEKAKLLEHITKLRLQKNNEFAIKEVFDDESFEENAKVLKEIVELLQNYKFRYAKKQPFLGEFFELLLTTGLKQEAGQFFTPVPIARFICKSIPIDNIIDKKLDSGDTKDFLPTTIDYAAGSGHFIIESMEEIQNIINSKDVSKYNFNIKKIFENWKRDPYMWAGEFSYGIEKDYRLVRTSKVGCYLHGDGIATVIHGDGLDNFEKSKDYKGRLTEFDSTDKQQNGAFDLVLSNPPYSVSSFKGNLKKENAEKDFNLYNSLTDNSSEIECLFIERTSQLLKEGGIAGIILPISILSKKGIYSKARELIFKDFEIISIVELGKQTFMSTPQETIIFFLRKRNKFFAKNLESSVSDFFENPKDITLNGVENAISKYVGEVWEDIALEDYITLLNKTPNESILNHEIFIDYSNKIKSKNIVEEIIEIEKEKLFYFVLTYPQKVVLVKSGEKKVEKEFLGYEFSSRSKKEGIHSFIKGTTVEDCTKLFDSQNINNFEKVSSYIYNAFNGKYVENISECLKDHLSIKNLYDFLKFDLTDFDNTLDSNFIVTKIDSRYKLVKIDNALEKVSGNTTKILKKNILSSGEYPVITQEKVKNINGYTNREDFISDVPLVLFGDHSCVFKYIDFNFFRGADGTVLLKPRKDFIAKYFYYVVDLWLTDKISDKGKYKRHYSSLKNLSIPKPPIDVQKIIIKEIEELEEKAKTVVINNLQAQKSKILTKYL